MAANELIRKNYKDIADAIRAKTGSSEAMTAEDMPSKIGEELAKKPEGILSITENNTYDVAQYASAEVNVAGLVPTGTKSITANGTGIDVTTYAAVDVNVPQGVFPSGTKSITSNGTGIDVTNYAAVNVNVTPQPATYLDAFDWAFMDSCDALNLGAGGLVLAYPYEQQSGHYELDIGDNVPSDFATCVLSDSVSTFDDLEYALQNGTLNAPWVHKDGVICMTVTAIASGSPYVESVMYSSVELEPFLKVRLHEYAEISQQDVLDYFSEHGTSLGIMSANGIILNSYQLTSSNVIFEQTS